MVFFDIVPLRCSHNIVPSTLPKSISACGHGTVFRSMYWVHKSHKRTKIHYQPPESVYNVYNLISAYVSNLGHVYDSLDGPEIGHYVI